MSTKKFNPNRLKSARLFEGFTIEKLAQSIGVSKQAVSLFEKGETTPKLETLMRIINVLQFPKEFFFSDDDDTLEVGNVYFRSQLTTNRMAKSSQEEKIKVILKCHYHLDKYVKFPRLNLPVLEENDWDNLSADEIELISMRVREFWGLGLEPIPNLVNVLEKNGIIVVALDTNDEKIDAYSKRVVFNGQEKYCVVLDESKKSAARRQFNAAHELGHILIHEAMGIEVSELTKEQYRVMEEQANLFAASFLLPREAFLNDLIYPIDLNAYIELKKKWKVSIAAMIVRAYKLGAINQNQYQYLMRKMSAKGYRTKEPLDNVLHMSKPILFQKAIDLIITNNVLTPNTLLKKFTLFNTKAEAILGLKADSLLEKKSDDNLFDLSFKQIR